MIEKKVITLSTATFIKLLVVVLLLWLGYLILDILLLFFIALIIASLIDPFADWFEKKRMPRGLAVLLIYVFALGIFAAIALVLVPAFTDQLSQLSANFGDYWNRFLNSLSTLKNWGAQYGLLEQMKKVIPDALQTGGYTIQRLLSSVFGFFHGVFSLVLVMVMAFYLVVEEDGFRCFLRLVTPEEHHQYLTVLWGRIKEKLGKWLRGQLALDLIVGSMSYLGFLIFDVQYALLLGVMAGIFETIPYAGPIFTAIVAVFLTFVQSGSLVKPLFVLAICVVVQQLENHILVPKVMQKAVGLNPVVSILSLLIGYRLMGVVGALLAIPIVTVISIIWSDLVANWQKKKIN